MKNHDRIVSCMWLETVYLERQHVPVLRQDIHCFFQWHFICHISKLDQIDNLSPFCFIPWHFSSPFLFFFLFFVFFSFEIFDAHRNDQNQQKWLHKNRFILMHKKLLQKIKKSKRVLQTHCFYLSELLRLLNCWFQFNRWYVKQAYLFPILMGSV